MDLLTGVLLVVNCLNSLGMLAQTMSFLSLIALLGFYFLCLVCFFNCFVLTGEQHCQAAMLS